MLRAVYLVVCVTVDVVGQETDCLHVGQQTTAVREQLDFCRSQERLGFLHITACVSFEDIHVDIDIIQILVIFGTGIGSCADEITDI